MGEAIKVLGQVAIPAATLTDVYTVPAATSAVISTITICNRTTSNARCRIAIAVAGAADDSKQYVFYDVLILKQDSFAATLGITLGAGDKLRAYADAASLSVNVFGTEIS